MDKRVGVAEAKAKLCELLDLAAAGEEITVTRSGKPHARIVPPASRPKRKFGMMRGKWPAELADLDWSPMTEEERRWAEGDYQNKDGIYTEPVLRKLRRERKLDRRPKGGRKRASPAAAGKRRR